MTGSALPLFLFLARRGARNVVRKRLRRLKEPRYLVGLLVGIGYFTLMFRGNHRGRPPVGVDGSSPVPGDLTTLSALGPEVMALGILLAILFTLLTKRGDAALPLSEAESLFLFSAPLSRRSVLHFAFLRVQALLLIPALVTTFLVGRGFSGRSPRSVVAALLGFSFLHLFSTAVAFTKAGWEDLPPLSRRLRKTALAALVLAAFGLVGVLGWERLAQLTAATGLGGGRVSAMGRLGEALPEPSLSWRLLLLPTRLLAEPLFARGSGFLTALLPALAILAALYLYVAGRPVRYEERTLAAARRRAEVGALRREGRLALPASAKSRRRVPFRLAPTGAPELAVLWKSLIAFNRSRLWVLAALAGCALVLAALAPELAARFDLPAEAGWVAVIPAAVLAVIGLTLPFGLRNDLRGDLEKAEVLRVWPLSPARLVAAQLAGPMALSASLIWMGIALPLGTAFGSVLSGRLRGLPGGLSVLDLVPLALSAAALLPCIPGIFLVVQNGATLAFPDWFPPGMARQAGIQASGTRILLFAATYLALGLALIPAAILALPVAIVGWGPLRFWAVLAGAGLGSAALLAEVGLGVYLLAGLWTRFDPSRDLSS